MSEFKREYRYQVIKLSDLERTPLSSKQKQTLLEVIQRVHDQRVSDGKGGLECVVVESDWPEYEPTWKAIEKRMSAPLSDQPDTRPGTPLMLTMETLDLWHQIIHDESLERGDRLQRIAARINVIQDSVKRAADQVNAEESYSAGVDRDRAAGIYRDTVPVDQINVEGPEHLAPKPAPRYLFDSRGGLVKADQPADAVVVPSDEELSALSLDSWERKYHKVRKEISLITWEEVYKRAYVEGFLAAQEGK